MRLARFACLLVLLTLLGPAGSRGFDPRRIDIIDYRLGMTEAEVTAVVEHQGFRGAGFLREDAPCPGAPTRRCVAMIEARTKDGILAFTFAAEKEPPVVARIAYTFDARKPGAPEVLERSVVARYGPPSVAAPMTWCQHRTEAGACPPGAPRLTFEPGQGLTRVLTLR